MKEPPSNAPPLNVLATDSASDQTPGGDVPRELDVKARNFVSMAAYQIVMRTGWIFKTESIVMPAVLDSVAGAGWIRGWLPLLNRFGSSLPPLLAAQHVKNAPLKRQILLVTTGMMALLFLLLSACFANPQIRQASWMPIAFLVIYTSFFMACGISHLAFNTLQGKLVLVTRRGRLLLVSNLVGSAAAVTCAFFLLPLWLQQESPRFDLIFAFSGIMFAGSAATTFFLRESRDEDKSSVRALGDVFADAWNVWRTDRNFRLLTVVGGLFSCSIMLFPHYQNLGLRELGLNLEHLMTWVVVQNIGTGLFSVPVGKLADRYGNRLVLLITLLGTASAPIIALAFLYFPEVGSRIFYLVFVFVGLTPVVLRTIQNFTLELCSPEDHPRYLGTLGICISIPMFCSPLIGFLIDAVGFTAVFSGMSAFVFAAWLLSFRLREPREHITAGFLPTVD